MARRMGRLTFERTAASHAGIISTLGSSPLFYSCGTRHYMQDHGEPVRKGMNPWPVGSPLIKQGWNSMRVGAKELLESDR